MSPPVIAFLSWGALTLVLFCLLVLVWARWDSWRERRAMRRRDQNLRKWGLVRDCYRDVRGVQR
jgi:hypothetical protein